MYKYIIFLSISNTNHELILNYWVESKEKDKERYLRGGFCSAASVINCSGGSSCKEIHFVMNPCDIRCNWIMIKQQRGRLKFESGSSRQSSKNTFVRRQATDRGGGVGGDPSTTSEHHPYSLFKSRSENRLLKDPSLQPDLYQYWIKAQAHFREYRVLRHLLAGSRPGQQERMCNVVSMWMCHSLHGKFTFNSRLRRESVTAKQHVVYCWDTHMVARLCTVCRLPSRGHRGAN